MFLDIIIPQYLEKDDKIDLLLSSINRQRGVDFNEIGIIMINDFSDVKISKELLKKYKNLNITYLFNEKNLGSGLTRQRGIDFSNAKYITFVDADDELYGDDGLYMILSCLKDTNADVVQASYVSQAINNNKVEEKIHDADYTSASLHAKFIKRSFLIENNIRFSDKLGCHFEDSYFSIILTAVKFNQKITYNIDYPIYLWKYNADSLTRGTDRASYYEKHFKEFMLCPTLVYDFIKDKEKEFAQMFFQKALIDIYVVLELLNGSEFTKIRKNYEKDFVELISKNRNIYYNVKRNDFLKLFQQEKKWYIKYLNIRKDILDILEFLNDSNILLEFEEE